MREPTWSQQLGFSTTWLLNTWLLNSTSDSITTSAPKVPHGQPMRPFQALPRAPSKLVLAGSGGLLQTILGQMDQWCDRGEDRFVHA